MGPIRIWHAKGPAFLRIGLGLALCLLAILPVADGRHGSAQRRELPGSEGGLAGGAEAKSAEAAREWLAIGPFRGEGRGAFNDAIERDWLALAGGEGSARPLAVQKLEGPEWTYVGASGGKVFLSDLAGSAEGGVAYAYREISSALAGTALLRIEAAGPLKLWVNGLLAYARYAIEPRSPDAETVGIGLERGKNRILVKVEGASSSFDFSLQFSPPGEAGRLPADAVDRGARLEVRLLGRIIAPGGEIRGFLPDRESGGDGGLEAGAFDSEGRLVAACPVFPPLPLCLALPASCSGPIFIRAMDGPSKGPATLAFVGDAKKAALASAAAARAAIARGGFADDLGFSDRGFDASSSLAFLADLLEGKTNPALERFDGAMSAMDNIAAIIALKGASPRTGRAWRLAYRSTIDDSLQPYSLFLPRPSPGKKPGIILALHDVGASDLDAMACLEPGYAGPYAEVDGAVIVAPYGRGETGWAGAGESDLEEALGLAEKIGDPDPLRRWIVGWGRGGFGALRTAQLRPLRFAAVASFGGLPGVDELDALEGTAVLIVRGKDDAAIGIEEARKAQARLDRAGADVELEESGGASSQEAWRSWSGGEAGRLLAWLAPHALIAWPGKVEVRAPSTRYGEAAGLRIIDIGDPAQPGALSLEVLDERHLALSTENLDTFEIDLDRPDLAASGRVLAVVDGRAFTLDARTRPRFVATGPGAGGGFSVQRSESGERGIAPHQGGGLEDLFRGHLRIVYGTKRPARTAFLRQIAESLSDWSPGPGMPFGSSLGRYGVLSDREATPAAIAGSSILLIGGPEDNRLSSMVAEGLPVTLSEKGVSVNGIYYKGAGASLVFPNPDAPAFLVGMLSIPFPEREAVAIVKSLIAPLRADPLSSSMRNSYRTPDLIVFDGSGRRLWAASFGPDWDGLRSWYE